jgi:uncharacterized membrane protein (DUF106 family)
MQILNTILGSIFGAVMLPFRNWPMLGLVLISAVVSVGILLIFKKVSNQERIEGVKRKIHAALFEIRLFNDDLGAIMRSQFDILLHNLSYLRLQLFPLLFILPPVVLIMAHLQPYYGYSGLEVGEPVLLKVEMQRPDGGDTEFLLDDKPAWQLEVPAGLELDSPGVWIPSKGEMVWRLAATEPGDYELQVKTGGETFAKSVRVTEETVRRSPMRVSSMADQFLYPVEKPFAKSDPIRSISVAYPEDPEVLLMPRWMWIFFILTIVFAFALRKPMGVTI